MSVQNIPPDSDKEQSMEMKAVVPAENDAVWPSQSAVSKYRSDYEPYI